MLQSLVKSTSGTYDMEKSAKTIQIFLPTGDPTGIRIAEITTSILRVIEIPRNLLTSFFEREDSSRAGIYFLFGENESGNRKTVYIGQSQNLKSRLSNHTKKDDWDRVVVVLSLTNGFTHTHIKFFEWLAINEAKIVDRFLLNNTNDSSKPNVLEPLEADCYFLFDLMAKILMTLGYPVFQKLITTKVDEEKLFYCRRNNIKGMGTLTDEGFVVLKGSIGAGHIDPKYAMKIESKRNEIIEAGYAKITNDQLIFEKDCLFKTPSGASTLLLAMSSNGWVEWKDSTGNTLHDIERTTKFD